MSKADGDLNRHFKKKKKFDAPSADHESCPPLQMGGLLSAIKKMKGKGAELALPTFLHLFLNL